MNINQFKEQYASFKDAEKIEITCDHLDHKPNGEVIIIGKQPAKRNILKNGGEQFICRKCFMKYDNPMNRVGQSRQTDENIEIYCPCPEHSGEPSRIMKKSCYYGKMEKPYLQTCGTCSQLGKEISEEQREKIRLALTGIERSDEFKEKLREYMKNNPEGIARASANLIPGAGGGWNEGQEMPEDTKQKMSKSHMGKVFTDEHCENISEGRKKMLEERGGFTREHRENISKATIRQYHRGFEPKLHHLKGWHESPKAGKVYFRSSYEKKAFMKLDEDESVKIYQTEAISTEYFHPLKEITSSFLIDLLVEFKDGSRKLIEVKPEKWLSDDVVIAKIEAGEMKAKDMGVSFEIWTEMNLFGHVFNEKNMRLFADKIRKKLI
jgi:hypothetical protein